MPTGPWLFSYIVLWLLVLIVCFALVMLVRQVGRLYDQWVRNDPEWGLPVGSIAPPLPESDAYQRPVVPVGETGRSRVLVFLSPGCRGCKDAVVGLARYNGVDREDLVLVVRATEIRTRLFASEYLGVLDAPPMMVIADPTNKVGEQYKVVAVPYVVAVGADGRIIGNRSILTLAEIGILLQLADHVHPSERQQIAVVHSPLDGLIDIYSAEQRTIILTEDGSLHRLSEAALRGATDLQSGILAQSAPR